MGIVKFFSSSNFDNKTSEINIHKQILSNPDPKLYRILREKRINNFLILKINYPHSTNYEGNKILVFKNCTILDLIQQKEGIDPHFSDNEKLISPVARFKPDDEGWKMAEFFVENFK
jgi:hypothetical protein